MSKKTNIFSSITSSLGGLCSREERDMEGRLFKYPEWDEYHMFDSDDLWSEHAYCKYSCVCVYVL